MDSDDINCGDMTASVCMEAATQLKKLLPEEQGVILLPAGYSEKHRVLMNRVMRDFLLFCGVLAEHIQMIDNAPEFTTAGEAYNVACHISNEGGQDKCRIIMVVRSWQAPRAEETLRYFLKKQGVHRFNYTLDVVPIKSLNPLWWIYERLAMVKTRWRINRGFSFESPDYWVKKAEDEQRAGRRAKV